ncbi:hypothetical protein WA026_002041 [Henosepilachna vigintioctopunctata]|uniref:Cyclin-dependent kinase 2-associated protein n=1 Tax=Henosepilachna vigintioctopunctata TaxID=420089 RepID=A0AAW1URN3_9CUCU
METVDIQAVESKLSDVTVTPIPMNVPKLTVSTHAPQVKPETAVPGQSKYSQILAAIQEIRRDVRPSYAGSKSAAERLKRGIVNARILVRECLLETERSARQ